MDLTRRQAPRHSRSANCIANPRPQRTQPRPQPRRRHLRSTHRARCARSSCRLPGRQPSRPKCHEFRLGEQPGPGRCGRPRHLRRRRFRHIPLSRKREHPGIEPRTSTNTTPTPTPTPLSPTHASRAGAPPSWPALAHACRPELRLGAQLRPSGGSSTRTIFVSASGTSYPAMYDCDSTASCQLAKLRMCCRLNR